MINRVCRQEGCRQRAYMIPLLSMLPPVIRGRLYSVTRSWKDPVRSATTNSALEEDDPREKRQTRRGRRTTLVRCREKVGHYD